MFY
ncbi:integral membrane domain protein, partial [Vibrio parahaemolyticus 970107]|jgi:SNF2 family DNA or RNA helicase